MKEFDLEAARRGEAIEVKTAFGPYGYAWSPAHFVGVDNAGDTVIQRLPAGPFERVYTSELRMKSRKRIVYLNFYPAGGAHWHNSEAEARTQASPLCTLIAHPAEIEE